METKKSSAIGLIPFAHSNQLPSVRRSMPPGIAPSTANTASTTSVRSLQTSLLAQSERTVVREEAAKVAEKVGLQIAICLDYTASTSHVVEAFRTQSANMLQILNRDCSNTSVLPVAFRGPWAESLSGPVGQIEYWEQIENVGNGRGEPPIVEGLREIERKQFFEENAKSELNFAVIATDERFVADPGYDSVTQYLRRTNAFVIAIISEDDERIPASFEATLGRDLPERVFTVQNVAHPEKIAADIILGIRKFQAERTVRERLSAMRGKTLSDVEKNDVPLLEKIAETLKGKWHSNALIGYQGERKVLK